MAQPGNAPSALRPQFDERLKGFMLIFMFLVIALFVGMQIGSSDYSPVVLGLLAVVGVWLIFFTGEYFWLITIASASLAGTFPVLGGSFTPFQILMAIGLGKFFIEEIVLRRRRLNPGPLFDRLMIAGFMGVLALHGIHDRFGMKFLGSTIWGGRNYVNIFVGMAAFFVLQSIPIHINAWRKLPVFVIAVASFDLFIALLTTAVPKLIYFIYPFYSAVSRTGVEELFAGTGAAETTRLGSAGNFGVLVTVCVLAAVSFPRLLSPANFFRLFSFCAGWAVALLSSFRTSVFTALAVSVVAALRDFKGRAVLFLPVLALGLFAISFINSEVVTLPRPVQRSLSFLPGHWDADMKLDAMDSTNWREKVWDMWRHDYFPLHPWIGRGFGFREEWAAQPVIPNASDELKAAVEVGNVHNGFYSALDNFGIIGTIFFVIWNIGIFVRVLKLPFDPRIPGNFVLWFVGLGLGASVICYWWGAQSVGPFLAQQFVAASVMLRLREKVREGQAERKRRAQPEADAAFSPALLRGRPVAAA